VDKRGIIAENGCQPFPAEGENGKPSEVKPSIASPDDPIVLLASRTKVGETVALMAPSIRPICPGVK